MDLAKVGLITAFLSLGCFALGAWFGRGCPTTWIDQMTEKGKQTWQQRRRQPISDDD